jgi:hypothetical protein
MGYSFWKVPAKILALNPKNKNSEPTTCHFHNIPFAARSEDWQSLITFSTLQLKMLLGFQVTFALSNNKRKGINLWKDPFVEVPHM